MRIKTGLVAIVLLTVATALAESQAPKTAVRDPEMIDASGYQKIVAQYRGQPLLVTFWATWCEPCRDEYPMLNELAKQYAPQGLKVVGVNLDDDGDLILMRRFLTRYKPVFPNYRRKAANEGDEAAYKIFKETVAPGWSGALPVSFFYAKDGRQISGILGEGTRQKYEAAIQALLGESH